MPIYQLILHTTGIRYQTLNENGSESEPVVGFYSTRRVTAANTDEGFRLAMRDFDADPKLSELTQSGHDAGLTPKTEIETIYQIGWLKSLLPWRQPGLALYDNADDE